MSSSERVNENGHLAKPGSTVELELNPSSVKDFKPFVRALPEDTAKQLALALEVLAAGDELGCFSILNRLPDGTDYGMAYNVLGSLMGKTIVAGSMQDAEKIMRVQAGKTGH